MNEHAGGASLLSALIVGAFAILLHDGHRKPTMPSSSPPKAAHRAPVDTNPIAPAPLNSRPERPAASTTSSILPATPQKTSRVVPTIEPPGPIPPRT